MPRAEDCGVSFNVGSQNGALMSECLKEGEGLSFPRGGEDEEVESVEPGSDGAAVAGKPDVRGEVVFVDELAEVRALRAFAEDDAVGLDAALVKESESPDGEGMILLDIE